ncbi:MAG TPA: alpha/beta hydrolase [Candidatus Methylomirabilis sp.]|nr:alpha/beta hydrolase [Candidatus Methylomirabilis sp.]
MPANRLRRDQQQWIFDWFVKETGRVFHWEEDGRGDLPRSVKRHAMISKHVGRQAQRLERIAREEMVMGHRETALDFYFGAASTYAAAQHPIMRDDSAEKAYLHGRSLACYDEVMSLAPYRIERIEVPWEDGEIQCNLHLLPGQPTAPCAIFIPGCDMTKEMYPDPRVVHAHQRGMHLLVMDGPGQGTSNLRKIRLTADNYERAGRAVVDYLCSRSEIEAANIVVYGISFGSFWALRLVAEDKRVRAVAAPWASYVDKYFLLDTFSPRYKQLFVYLTGAGTEEDLDAIAARMTMDGYASSIQCPVLLTVGEYDARSPVNLVYDLFDALHSPKELWVYEDQHHILRLAGGFDVTRGDSYALGFDWLRDAIDGRFPRDHARKVYLRVGGGGPNGTDGDGRDARRWWE